MDELKEVIGISQACAALDLARSSFYQAKGGSDKLRSDEPTPPKPQRRALTPQERQEILDVCDSERFCDVSPREIYATLLDEGVYLASIPTFYRILADNDQVKERRSIAKHPPRTKPELVACAPNQTWSWDITKLKGPSKGSYFHLYVILDIYSRYGVGWRVEATDSAELASELIDDAITSQGVDPTDLTIHADNGASMASKSVATLLSDLGVTKTHSRPHTSNDNPYSEAQFKTLKYRPDFPDRFASVAEARVFVSKFFHWYHFEHRHSGIGLMTPADVHNGYGGLITNARAKVLRRAYRDHPERFVNKIPEPPKLAKSVWINRPEELGLTG